VVCGGFLVGPVAVVVAANIGVMFVSWHLESVVDSLTYICHVCEVTATETNANWPAFALGD